jgi:hypothetical protein
VSVEPPPVDPADATPPTAADVARLTALRRRTSYADAAALADDVRFLLDLVDRLLGRALLPGEDWYLPESPADRWTVRSGPSIFMCGHGSWRLQPAGSYRVTATFTAGALDAARLRALVNGRDPRDPPTPDLTPTPPE